jgi:predicted transcriptional regulator
MPRRPPPPPLHELEAEVMEELWRRERATVREVMDALNANAERPRAYTTYMTVMARLDGKGLLRRRRVGKTDVYRPALDRDAYRRRRAQAEVDDLLGEYGDVALAQFMERVDALDPERAEELRRLARGE